MKFNGNIQLNTLGQSEVQNLVIERLSVTPAFVVSEAGRVVYNTTQKKYFMNNGTQWIAIATGGDATVIANELDAVEAAVGLATDGTFVPWSGTNFLNATTTIKDGIAALDTSLKAEETSRVTSDSALQNNIDAEATARNTADATLQTNITAEATARAAADGDLTTLNTGVKTDLVSAINDLKSTSDAADTTLQTNIDNEAATRLANDTTLQTNIDNEAATRLANDTTLQTNITAEATTRATADTALGVRIDNVISSASAAGAAQTAVDAAQDVQIGLKVAKAGDTMSGTLAMNNNIVSGVANPINVNDAVNKGYVDQAINGLAWQDPVRSINLIDDSINSAPVAKNFGDVYVLSAGPGLNGWELFGAGDIVQWDGVSWILVQGGPVAAGDRFVVSGATATTSGITFTDNTIVVWNGTAFTSTTPNDKESVFVSDPQSVNFGQSFVYSGVDSAWYQFSGPAQIGAGIGLTYSGNTMNIGLGAGIAQLPTDEVGVETYPAGGLHTTSDGTTDSTLTGAMLSVKRDGTTLTSTATGIRVSQVILDDITANTTSINAENTRALAAEALVQSNLDAETLARTSADTTLQSNIDTENTRALAAEALVQSNLDAETLARTSADTALNNSLTTEIAARTSADTSIRTDFAAADTVINNRVSSMYYLYTSTAANTTHTVDHLIGAKFCNVTVIHSGTDEQIIPQSVVFNSTTQLTVTFNTAIDCHVVVMGLV